MTMNAELLRQIERKTGKTIGELQSGTIDERRKEVETKSRKTMSFSRLFPFIGRGSVMGEFLLSHSEINKQLDHALR